MVENATFSTLHRDACPKTLRPQCKALGSAASLVEVIGSAAWIVQEL